MSFDDSRLRELKSALSIKTADNQALADSFPIENGTVVVDSEKLAVFQKNMSDIKEIKSLIDGLTEMKSAESYGDGAGDSVAAALAAGGTVNGMSLKTLGEMFVESAEFKALNGGKNGATMVAPYEAKSADIASYWAGGGIQVKDIYSAMPSGPLGAFGRTQREEMVMPLRRRARVRDLFPSRQTNASIIEFYRQTGFVNAASTVPERNASNTNYGLKPQSTIAFSSQQAPIRTIAHWESAHRNALADEPQLRAIIDNELLYGLRLVEDAQILDGDGVGENLLGLLRSGIQDYNWSSGANTPVKDNKADAIRRAATLAYLAQVEPTGVVLHPNDWEDIELTKNSQGTYLMAISIQSGAEQRLWRMPVIDTPAMPEGRALVGAFGTGAQIYDREAANIRVSENHADFFVRNAIVILAEERLGLVVKRPESFVNVDFDGPPA